jgi:adenine-specific DNA-methyltransferase
MKRTTGKFLNKIHLGDCLELLKALPDECVDLIVTSPPYNIGKSYEKKASFESYLDNQMTVLRQSVRVLKSTGSIFWQVGTFVDGERHIPLDIKIFPLLEGLGLIPKNRIVWLRPHGVHAERKFSGRHETILWFVKSSDYKFFLDPIRVPQKYPDKKYWKGEKHGELSCDPLGKNPGDVWAFRNVRHNHEEQTIHPCQFPEDLIERILLCTTSAGDLVLDPYMGVGTVAVVAKRFGRNYTGAEVLPEYVDVAEHRLSGEPDRKGNFPNLKSLREYAEAKGIHDVSEFSFTRQTARSATTRKQSRIHPEQTHLERFVEQTEGESAHPAFKRFAAPSVD